MKNTPQSSAEPLDRPEPQSKAAQPTRLLSQQLASDEGATTAEYAITTLAACGLAALLVTLLKSETLLELVTGVITSAFGLAG
ncbi:DUF4244 domain-containing protein [Brevibacterium otitidis]|uniref:DUF4244 domain-containing protein n=1 Tax=Brevibacterium otitidis TaxID=53364 RepID=A0ABV5WYY5_9MICO|nr:hypothetical protein GCM10023233_26160 [Brevibacterium otitidis]